MACGRLPVMGSSWPSLISRGADGPPPLKTPNDGNPYAGLSVGSRFFRSMWFLIESPVVCLLCLACHPASARSRTGVSANRLDWCCRAGMFKSHIDPGLDLGDAQDLNQRRPQTTVWKEWVNDDARSICSHSCACHRKPYLKMSNRLCVISGNERLQEWTSAFATTALCLSRVIPPLGIY